MQGDCALLQSPAKRYVAIPDQRYRAAVSLHEQVDLEAWIGDAQFRRASLADDPAKPPGGGLVGKVELDDGTRLRHAVEVHAPVHVPHDEVGVGLVCAQVR